MKFITFCSAIFAIVAAESSQGSLGPTMKLILAFVCGMAIIVLIIVAVAYFFKWRKEQGLETPAPKYCEAKQIKIQHPKPANIVKGNLLTITK